MTNEKRHEVSPTDLVPDTDNGSEHRPLRYAVSVYKKGKNHRHWRNLRFNDRASAVKKFRELAHPLNLKADKYAAGGFVAGNLVAGPASTPCDPMPCTKRFKHKTKDTVEWRSWLTLDFDAHDPGLPDRVAALGVAGFCHWTANATNDHQKWRVQLFTDRDVTPEEHDLLAYFATVKIKPGGESVGWDKASWSYWSTMYFPASTEPADFRFVECDGPVIPVDDWLEDIEFAGVTVPAVKSRTEPSAARKPYDGTPATDAHRRAAERLLQRLCSDIATAPDNQRHKTVLGEASHQTTGVCAVLIAGFDKAGCYADDPREILERAMEEAGWDMEHHGATLDDAWAKAEPDLPHVQDAETAAEVFSTTIEDTEDQTSHDRADPFAVLTGHVTRGLGRRSQTPIAPWKTKSVGANDLAKAILERRWTNKGESGEEDCKVLRMWASVAYEWHTTHWEAIPHDHLEAELKRVLEAAVTPVRNKKTGAVVKVDGKVQWKPVGINPTLLGNIARLIELDTIVHARLGSGHWIDCTNGRCVVGEADRRYISFRNGILDLTDGTLFRHESAFFNTYSLRFDYEPEATAPFWVKTLEQWFPGDQQSQDTLEEVMGYLLLGGMELDKIFVLLGKPRAGKGTIMRIVKNMLGTGFSAQALDEMGDRFGKEDLIGKRVVHITEAVGGKGAKKVVSTMKAISGRDDGATVKTKGGKSTTVDFECRFVLTGNEDLELPDSSGVIADRVVALYFGRSFLGNENHGLDAALAAEYSGIFNRLRLAYGELVKRGRFVQPATGLELIDRIRRSAAPGKVWFEETFEVTKMPGDVVSLDAVAQHYKDNCEEAVGKSILACKRIVGAMLTDAGLVVTREGNDDEKVRVVRGIKVKELLE